MLGLTQYNLCREDGEAGEGIIRESLHFTKMENSMTCKSSLSVKVEPSGFVLILHFFSLLLPTSEETKVEPYIDLKIHFIHLQECPFPLPRTQVGLLCLELLNDSRN